MVIIPSLWVFHLRDWCRVIPSRIILVTVVTWSSAIIIGGSGFLSKLACNRAHLLMLRSCDPQRPGYIHMSFMV